MPECSAEWCSDGLHKPFTVKFSATKHGKQERQNN